MSTVILRENDGHWVGTIPEIDDVVKLRHAGGSWENGICNDRADNVVAVSFKGRDKPMIVEVECAGLTDSTICV